MLFSRRGFLASSLLSLTGCGGSIPTSNTDDADRLSRAKTKCGGSIPTSNTDDADRLSRAKTKAVRYLLARQSPNGSWCSDVYGTFKDGTALTPLVLNSLLSADPDQKQAIVKAARFLNAMVDGTKIVPPPHGFDFALYTSALAVTALCHPRCPRYPRERDAWLSYLKKRQLTEGLGWHPNDREYGGWGYSRGVPHKPKPNALIPPLTESNLSATTFALEAMHAAKVPLEDPLWKKALVFVHRCQNWAEQESREPKYDDGGFYFIYDDPVRNKAGLATQDDRAEEVRYRSYGSATCDGLRCLMYARVPKTNPRRRAAHDWLVKHFSAQTHPGNYAKVRRMDRESVYFYYASSFAKTPLGSAETLRHSLVDALIAKQAKEGSWSNPTHAVREDDPILATSFALWALSTASR